MAVSGRLKLWAIQVAMVGLLLLLIEAAALFYLKSKGGAYPYFINGKANATHLTRSHNEAATLKNSGYNLAEPLLGWDKSNQAAQARNLKQVNGCVELATAGADTHALRIFITGGSTTDLFLNPRNWPVELLKLCGQAGANVKIYVAAVGNYNSGQEVLKLLQNGLPLKPHLHISYSGANEYYNGAYVSEYEQGLYAQALAPKGSLLLPNTVGVVRRWLNTNKLSAEQAQVVTQPQPAFWQQNMRAMQGIAAANGYRFMGVLQPVRGIGLYRQSGKQGEDIFKEHLPGYRSFYPVAIAFADTCPYLTNLTAVFDTVKGDIYTDDCHLNNEYQHLPARAIFSELQSRGWLVRPINNPTSLKD